MEKYNKDIDIPNLIRTNDYYNLISYIKNYEDSLQKIFQSNNKSNLIENDDIYIWPINKNINNDLFENMIIFDYKDFGILIEKTENIVITGPYVRNCLINALYNNEKSNNLNIRKDVYLYCFEDNNWENLILNFNDYTEKENEYVYEKDDKKISLIKKRYKSTSNIILQHDYIKRIGWRNESFYVSSMFLIEYQKHKNAIMSKFCDPILNIPYDPLGIYLLAEKNHLNPIRIIESIDLPNLLQLSPKNILKLYGNKTLIELCLDKYMVETHHLIIENLEKMIIFLLTFKLKRPCRFYAQLIKLHKKNEELYNLILKKDREFSDIKKNKCATSIDDINNIIIEHLIYKDKSSELINYITSIKGKINRFVVDSIIKYKSKNIINDLIHNSMLDKYSSYYVILMTENIDLIKSIDFNMEIAVNFLKDIITNGIYGSFLYLLENDESILTTIFENKQNILHIIKPNGEYDKIIDKIMELKSILANVVDEFGETPIIYHSKLNPDLLPIFLKYDSIDLTIFDNDGNNCLHHICKNDDQNILKIILKKYPELINMPNNNSEYPIMIACKNKQEDIFYIMKKHLANLDVKDKYGNTVYHYVCSNSICLGMFIESVPNFFGLTPKDYCKLSSQYYCFDEQ
jgi:hypothetical protein